MIGRLKAWMRLASAGKRQRRRRVVPWWRTPRTMVTTCVIAGLGVVATAAWSWRSGTTQRLAEGVQSGLIRASAGIGFEIHEVFVVGRKRTPREQLIAALGADRGQPILALDLDAARRRMLALPWVRSVSIERLLPDTVVVRLIEREPVALWQKGGVFSLIDGDGVVIEGAAISQFADLIVVVGDDAPENVGGLLALLAEEPDFKPLIKAAVRVGERRWNLHIDGGLEIRLPADDPAQAWHLLAGYQRTYRLLEKGLQMVDLRFLPDRLIVRRVPPGDERRSGAGHSA